MTTSNACTSFPDFVWLRELFFIVYMFAFEKTWTDIVKICDKRTNNKNSNFNLMKIIGNQITVPIYEIIM
jgi:hypothetical protein